MFVPDVSGLIIQVPEAERLRHACTDLLHPDEQQRIAAHITLLFPFLPPQQLDEALLAELQHLFRSYPAFSYKLTHVARFPEALYLTPEPAQPFITLIKALMTRYPECRPYDGKYLELIPHLTVAQAEKPTHLDRIEAKVIQFCKSELPLRLQAREVALVVRQSGLWSQRATFRLG